ncbi:hypothetical protein C8R48DRAFT_668551 [Suillus tomentosus]|nr:hypothetical protein C8R48DRAFT_668551 [Suillus tomentosus]
MPGASWTTHEQTVWLKSKMDGFRLSQLQGSVSAYLNQLCLEWFVKWPEVGIHFKDSTTGIPLTEAELTSDQIKELGKLVKQRKGQLRSYCYRGASSAGRARHTQFTKTITKLMATSTARTRGPTAVEHFLQTDYKEDSSIKEEVAAQVENEASKVMAARGEAYVMQMEEQAKAECRRRAERAKCELEGLRNPSDSLKLQYIEGLGGVAGQLLETIFETTGWHGSIYLGGPDPRANGDVRVFSFHHGKGSTGFTFRDSLPDHTKRIVEPFTMFLKGAFATSATSAPPEVLEHIDVFSGVDTFDPTPLTFDPIPPTTSDSVPIVEGGGVSIHPAENELRTMIHPTSHGPHEYTFPNSSFDSGFYESLNPYLSLPEPEPDTESGLPILPPFLSQNSPDTPITAWKKDLDAGRITSFSPPRLSATFARVASHSPSGRGKTIPRARPVTLGKAKAPSIYDHLCDSTSTSPRAPPAVPVSTVPMVPAVPVPATRGSASPTPPPSASATLTANTSAPPATPAVSPFASAAPATHGSATPATPAADVPPFAYPPTSPTAVAPVADVSPSASPPTTTIDLAPKAPVSNMSTSIEMCPASTTVDQTTEEVQPFDDVLNQSFRRGSRMRLPSTCLTDANKIGGTSKRSRKSVA